MPPTSATVKKSKAIQVRQRCRIGRDAAGGKQRFMWLIKQVHRAYHHIGFIDIKVALKVLLRPFFIA